MNIHNLPGSLVAELRREVLFLAGHLHPTLSGWTLLEVRSPEGSGLPSEPERSGVRPMRRHQPRAMLLVAGFLAVEKVRSAPVRRA